MTDEELNRRIAEFAGFELQGLDGEWIFKPSPTFKPLIVVGKRWVTPDGTAALSELPDFAHSLDALFKWAVPKLYELEGFRLLNYQYIGFAGDIDLHRHSWSIYFEDDNLNVYRSGDGSAPTLARVIEQVIL